MPIAYRSAASCMSARSEMVAATSDLGYDRVVAECRPQATAPRKIAAKALQTA